MRVEQMWIPSGSQCTGHRHQRNAFEEDLASPLEECASSNSRAGSVLSVFSSLTRESLPIFVPLNLTPGERNWMNMPHYEDSVSVSWGGL